MKATLARISLFAIKLERYLPVAMMVFALALKLITPDGVDSGGGTGLK